MNTRDKLLKLDKQLQKLEERLERLITKQARSFYKAAERIFKDGFCPKLALKILAQAHETAVAIQKQEEEARMCSIAKGRLDAELSNSESEDHYEPF